MRKQLLSLFSLGSLAMLAQAPAIQWQKSLGGTGTDYGNSVKQTSDGGYIVAGKTNSNDGDVTLNKGSNDYWVTKLDSIGALTWEKTLGGSGDDQANAVIQTLDGGYVVAGSSNSNDSNVTNARGQYDVWIVKLGRTGAIKWQKAIGGTAADYGWDIQQTSDLGYIIAADSRSNNYDATFNNGVSDFWVIKTDSLGVIQWQKSLGGSGSENAYSVQQTADGGYIVAGQTNSSSGDVSGAYGGKDFWVTKLSGTGSLQWQKCLGGTSDEIAYSVKQTSDGGFIVAGQASSNNGLITAINGPQNVWLVKLTSTGSVTWQKCYGGDQYDGANSIQQCADGGYVFAGTVSSNTLDVSGNHGGNDYWVVKTFSTGAIQWQKCLGGTGSDLALSIQTTTDNGYVVAGRSTSSNGDVTNAIGLADFWVVKFAGVAVTQTSTPTGIAGVEVNNRLLTVYPNPGKGIITVSMDQSLLAQASSLQVVNTMGQLLYKNDLEPSESLIDLSNLADQGIYFFQIKDRAGAVIATKKLVKN